MGARILHKTVAIETFGASEAQESYITVWIHGTSNNPLIRKIHASPPGLLGIEALDPDLGVKRLGQAMARHVPARIPEALFYAFGWSGRLSFKERRLAALNLVNQLRVVVDKYARAGVVPRIRLIGHSHGCNVILNASEHLLEAEPPLIVDEFIFLACPVQHATARYISSPAFKNIYSLYSRSDLLQVLDMHGLNLEGVPSGGKLFSERRFASQSNLVQAEIRWNRNGLSHAGFIRRRFGEALPSILALLRRDPEDCVISIVPSLESGTKI